VAVSECPEKGVQSPTPIGGLDFLDMDRLIKYPEIKVLDFLDTPPLARALMGSTPNIANPRLARPSAYVM